MHYTKVWGVCREEKGKRLVLHEAHLSEVSEVLTGLMVLVEVLLLFFVLFPPSFVEDIEVLSSLLIYARREITVLVHDLENSIEVMGEETIREVHSNVEC